MTRRAISLAAGLGAVGIVAALAGSGCSSTSPGKATATRTATVIPVTNTPSNTFTNTSTPTPASLYVYVVTGWETGRVSTVYSAQLMPAGAVGTWTTQTAYPSAQNNLAVLYNGGSLFGLAGYGGSTGSISAVYRASAVSGTVGAWTADTALPVILSEAGVAQHNGYIFTVGGYAGGGAVSTVYVNTISGSGLGGSWSTTTALPAVRTGPGAAVSADGYMYSFGGAIATQSTVYSSQITGGTLGTWTSVGALPVAQAYMGTVTDGSTVYIAGGNATGSTNVLAASIGAGALGSWSSVALPSSFRTLPGVALYGGYLYIFGGYTTSSTSAVYSASVTGTTIGSFTSQTAMPAPRGYLKVAVGP